MNRVIDWNEILQLVINATGETLYMVLLAGLFTLLIGLPLGVLLFISRRQGLYPLPRLNQALGAIINLGRSLPFVVMMASAPPAAIQGKEDAFRPPCATAFGAAAAGVMTVVLSTSAGARIASSNARAKSSAEAKRSSGRFASDFSTARSRAPEIRPGKQ